MQALATPVPQNFTGETLVPIRDTGADPNDPSTRLYKTRAEQDFHTGGADIIGLRAQPPIELHPCVRNQLNRRTPTAQNTFHVALYVKDLESMELLEQKGANLRQFPGQQAEEAPTAIAPQGCCLPSGSASAS